MTYRWWASVSGADRARRPASVVVVITADEEQGGFVVRAYDNEGRSTVAETWHGGLQAARGWAASEHQPDDLSRWEGMPDSVVDGLAYALRHASRRR